MTWCGIAALLASLPGVISNGYYLTLATNVAITMILTLSLNFTIGRIGLFSLAHSAFLGIGAYLAAILAQRHGISPWLTLPVAVAGSCSAAAIIGVPVLRLRGMFLSVATLSFGLFAEVFARQASDITGGAYGVTGIPPLVLFGITLRGTGMYELALAVLLLTALILENIRLSRFGRAIVASRDNEAAAAAAGIDIARTATGRFHSVRWLRRRGRLALQLLSPHAQSVCTEPGHHLCLAVHRARRRSGEHARRGRRDCSTWYRPRTSGLRQHTAGADLAASWSWSWFCSPRAASGA